MLTDFTQEVEDPIMGVYFESIIQSLGRKPRAVQFSTDVGDMLIQVA